MAAVRLVVVRHGESEWNAAGRWQGHGGSGLSSRGAEQAQATARHLAADLDDVLLIARSDLQRVEETSAPIEAALDVPVEIDERLRELDIGWWSGLTVAEITARDTTADAATFRAGGDRTPEQDAIPIGGAESLRDLRARVSQAMDAFVTLGEQAGGGSIVVVTHGWPVRVTAAMAAGLAPGQERRLRGVRNCATTVIDRTGDDAVLVAYNCTDHLDELTAIRR